MGAGLATGLVAGLAGDAALAGCAFFGFKGADMAGRIIMPCMENPTQFVEWLRSVAPYIHAFRGKTFVIAFPGELVMAGALPVLAHDLSLLHALGIKVVIVHGSRPQVEEQLALRKVEALPDLQSQALLPTTGSEDELSP